MKHHAELQGKTLLFLMFLWYLWFSNLTIRAIFAPILPLIEDEFAVSHAKAAGIFVFTAIGYALSVLLAGIYAGRFGYKRSLLVSFATSTCILFAIPFVRTFPLFYVIAFLMGFSGGVYLPCIIPLITEYVAEKDWGKSIAIHDSGAAIGIFCTPLIAIGLLHFFPWKGIFGFLGVFLLINTVALHFLADEVKIGPSEKTSPGGLARHEALWITMGVWTFASGANMGLYSITPLYLTKELGMSIAYANAILGISRLGGVGIAIVAGFLVDRVSLRKTMFTMLCLAGIFTVLLGVVPVRFIGPTLFLQAVFVSGFFPLGLVSIARTFDREMRGMATGLIAAVSTMLGGGLLPYLLGLSGDRISFRFGIACLGMSVCAVSFVTLKLKEAR